MISNKKPQCTYIYCSLISLCLLCFVLFTVEASGEYIGGKREKREGANCASLSYNTPCNKISRALLNADGTLTHSCSSTDGSVGSDAFKMHLIYRREIHHRLGRSFPSAFSAEDAAFPPPHNSRLKVNPSGSPEQHRLNLAPVSCPFTWEGRRGEQVREISPESFC